MDRHEQPPESSNDNPRRPWALILVGLVAASGLAGILVWAGLNLAPVPKKVPDTEAIVGRWKFVDVQLDASGTRPDNGPMPSVWEIRADGSVTITTPGLNTSEGTIHLDPSAHPKAIDLGSKGDGQKSLGLYALDRDTLTLCICFKDAKSRPTELKADGDSATHLWVFKRVTDN